MTTRFKAQKYNNYKFRNLKNPNKVKLAKQLGVKVDSIVRIENWAKVIFVVVSGVGARFVSKKNFQPYDIDCMVITQRLVDLEMKAWYPKELELLGSIRTDNAGEFFALIQLLAQNGYKSLTETKNHTEIRNGHICMVDAPYLWQMSNRNNRKCYQRIEIVTNWITRDDIAGIRFTCKSAGL